MIIILVPDREQQTAKNRLGSSGIATSSISSIRKSNITKIRGINPRGLT